MSNARLRTRLKVGDPAEVERFIEETKNRIAAGVKIITAAEREMKARQRDFDNAWAHAIKNAEGPEYLRKAEATIMTAAYREKADDAKIAFGHAERTADALNKELFSWQAILKSVTALLGAAGVRG